MCTYIYPVAKFFKLDNIYTSLKKFKGYVKGHKKIQRIWKSPSSILSPNLSPLRYQCHQFVYLSRCIL